ncbi:hypothetical protein ACHAW5_002027 [Stephanodiscus triporus]|uniref:Uncharacterized protein n=1 Tax=Stephanodiscus triporus TaxID=2934178 RepID=A0ABD3QN27_9STRA
MNAAASAASAASAPTTPSTSSSRPFKLTSTSQTLPHGHLDHVLDVSFDYYGRRFATCGADRTVRVWDLNADGVWDDGGMMMGGGAGGGGGKNNGGAHANEWQAHRGPVNGLSWAHPEFGQLLATAGADHAVVIWEEREGGFDSLATPERSADGFFEPADNGGCGGDPSQTNNRNVAVEGGGGGATSSSSSSSSRWVSKATLSDARRAVTCVEFAPRHLGLRLASGSADGMVRVYEALDTMNLNHWKLEAEVEENVDGGGGVVDDAGAATAGGRGRGAAGGGGDGSTSSFSSSNENLGVSSLSWCNGRFEPATLVVGYSSGRVSVIRYDDGRRTWLEVMRLPGHAIAGPSSGGRTIPRGVLDVSWAPNVGRSFHLIASCGKDDRLQVHRIRRGRVGGVGGGERGGSQQEGDAGNIVEGGGLAYEGTALLDQGRTNWRCQWNVTGTVLASSGDGGTVKLWKNDYQGRWKCVSEIVGDPAGAVATAASSAVRNQ